MSCDVSGVIFSRVAPVSGEENSGYFGTDSAAPSLGGGGGSPPRQDLSTSKGLGTQNSVSALTHETTR